MAMPSAVSWYTMTPCFHWPSGRFIPPVAVRSTIHSAVSRAQVQSPGVGALTTLACCFVVVSVTVKVHVPLKVTVDTNTSFGCTVMQFSAGAGGAGQRRPAWLALAGTQSLSTLSVGSL